MTIKSVRNVDLNLLVVFDTVYATGNISHAAKQLSLTQPAVSNAISRLREHFDDLLFVRSGRGVKPTSRSQQMIEPVRNALKLIRSQIEGPSKLDLATYKRDFRIVIVDTLESHMLSPALQIIEQKAPGITIESRPAALTTILDDLKSGTLDLACYPFIASLSGIVIIPICAIDYVVVCRRGHPGIGKKLDAETFLKLGHVGLIPELRNQITIDRDMTTRGGPRRLVYSVHKIWSIPAIVATTDLVSFLPRHFAHRWAEPFQLDIHELPVPISPHEYHMMWHEKNTDDPGHKWLRETMLKAMWDATGSVPSGGIEAAGKSHGLTATS